MKKWVKDGYFEGEDFEEEEEDEKLEQLVGESFREELAEEVLSGCQNAVEKVT